MAGRLSLPDRTMIAAPVFVLTGFASEYALGDIAKLLRHAGEQVVEVDFSQTALPDLGERDVVLITSQHPARTAWLFRKDYGQIPPYNQYLSPMECATRLNVRCAVLIPHDLEQPIVPDEIGYLSLFDIYCSPFAFSPGLPIRGRTIHTGWAKYTDAESPAYAHQELLSTHGVFFVNKLMELLRLGGGRYLLEQYPFLARGEVPIKLPYWPGVTELEAMLVRNGARIIPSNTSSTQLIAHAAIVLANAEGSTLAEAAYLGVPAHILPPGTDILPEPSPRQTQRQRFDFRLMMSAIGTHLKENRGS